MTKPDKMSNVKHGVRFILGWCVLLLGVVGLFLPILQGILFLAVGSILLAPYMPCFGRFRDRLTARFPALHHVLERWKARADRLKSRLRRQKQTKKD